MAIPPGTTPTLTFTLPQSINLTEADHVYLSLKSGTASIIKSDADLVVTENTVSVTLTQSESLIFCDGATVKAQVNWVYSDGSRSATDTSTFLMGEQMVRRVLPHV